MLQDANIPFHRESWLGEADVRLLSQGRHLRPWEKLGAHPCTLGGVAGTAFAVWAPHAQQVSVVGDFNHWDVRQHVMRQRVECGAWEVFVPGVTEGALYQFSMQGDDGRQVLKTDPYALHNERGSDSTCIVMKLPESVQRPTGQRARANALNAPMSIYEVHVGSWRRPNGAWPDWDELTRTLVPYVVALGFTHIELMPVNEHPFYGSSGYQLTGLYAPTVRYGTPDAFRGFVAAAHDAGLQVLLDWVPAHLPANAYTLAHVDGSAPCEPVDPCEACHRDWKTPGCNYSCVEFRNFLLGNALFWVERYGIDGLRVDAVASMLYRDHGRSEADWIPGRNGRREDLEAIDFLREFNAVLGQEAPGAITVAEESTAYPGVTAPGGAGGLGFHHKWNLGWMHDTLTYFAMDPVDRPQHHDRISFALMYAYSERFVLALSHDEVAPGKGSLYNKMWGDPWQKRANLRALYALMYAHPGRKLLFMGSELAQLREWNHDGELDWHLLDNPDHAGVQRLVRDLNHLYRSRPALHARDDEPGGFGWIEVPDPSQSVFSFVRHGLVAAQPMVVVCNMASRARHDYRLGVPLDGVWQIVMNTDAACYGGADVGHDGTVVSERVPWQGNAASVLLNLPPLGVLWLEPGASA